MKNLTFDEILKQEYDLWYLAEETFGEHFRNAFAANLLLQNFLEEVSPKAALFMVFLSQLKSHNTLALLSTVRLHKVQSLINLRYCLEAGADAAYALANPAGINNFALAEDGLVQCSQDSRKKRYEWLAREYSAFSDWNKNQKKNLNDTVAHNNFVYAQKTFASIKDGEGRSVFANSFFDHFDDFHIKTDLWFITNIIIMNLDVFWGINQKEKSLKFKDSFVSDLKNIETVNNKLKDEMMKTDRYNNIKGLKK